MPYIYTLNSFHFKIIILKEVFNLKVYRWLFLVGRGKEFWCLHCFNFRCYKISLIYIYIYNKVGMRLYYLKCKFRFHIFILKKEVIEKWSYKMFSCLKNLVTIKCPLKKDLERTKKNSYTDDILFTINYWIFTWLKQNNKSLRFTKISFSTPCAF